MLLRKRFFSHTHAHGERISYVYLYIYIQTKSVKHNIHNTEKPVGKNSFSHTNAKCKHIESEGCRHITCQFLALGNNANIQRCTAPGTYFHVYHLFEAFEKLELQKFCTVCMPYVHTRILQYHLKSYFDQKVSAGQCWHSEDLHTHKLTEIMRNVS